MKMNSLIVKTCFDAIIQNIEKDSKNVSARCQFCSKKQVSRNISSPIH